MTRFARLPGSAEYPTRIGVRGERLRLSKRRKKGVMTGLACQTHMALFKFETRACMRVEVKVVRRKAIAVVTSQTRLFLILRVIELLLMHVLMAARTLIGGAPRISLKEALPGGARVATAALQAVVRRIQTKATRSMPTRFKDRIVSRPTRMSFAVAKRAAIATGAGRRVGKRNSGQKIFAMR